MLPCGLMNMIKTWSIINIFMTLANILKNRSKYLGFKYTCEWNTHLHADKCALNF